MLLPLGARVTVMRETENYCQIGAGAYLSRLHLRSMSNPETDIVAVARRFLAQPYILGGNGAQGLDCSGLVQMSLSVCGVDAPRNADLQEAALGESVAVPDQIGDLLFWPGHVGILATRTRLLHANATHMAVVEEKSGAGSEANGARRDQSARCQEALIDFVDFFFRGQTLRVGGCIVFRVLISLLSNIIAIIF